MFIQVQINTDEELSAQDRRILEAMAGAGDEHSAAVIQMADARAAQAKAAQEEQETPPAAPTRSRTRKAAAKPPEPEPEPQDDATDSDDLIGDDEPTVDDAVKRAQDLVQAGKGPAIKKALTKVGAAKVRDLEGDQIQAFLDAVAKA